MIRAVRELIVRHKHVNWALADQGLVSGVNFATGILLARFLGLDEFGRFTLAWLAVQFINSIQFALVSAPMMTIGPKQEADERPAYYGAVLFQQVVLAALSFAVLWGSAAGIATLYPAWRLGDLALPLACAAFAFQIQDHLRRYFFTRGRARMAFVSDALRYPGQLAALAAAFWLVPVDSRAALWAIAAAAAAAAVVSAVAVGEVRLRRHSLRAVALRHWRFSRWLTASAVMHWLSGNLFLVIAGPLLGPAAVGALRAAQNLMGVMHVLFQGLENVVVSRAASRLHDEGVARLAVYLRDVAGAMLLVTAAVAVIVAVAPGFWLALIYGEPFRAFGGVLQWYAVIYIVMSLTLPLRAGLNALENTRPIFVANLCSLVYVLASCYWFVNTFGIFGALYGMFGSFVLIQLVLWFGLRAALARTEARTEG